jgi:hypothetical protein
MSTRYSDPKFMRSRTSPARSGGLRRSLSVFALLAIVHFVPSGVRAFSPTDKARVLYVGDSISFETRDAVTFFVAGTGKADVRYIGFGGAAICDVIRAETRFLDATNKLAYQVREFKPHLVALTFWGNPAYFSKCAPTTRGSEAFYAQYLADARAAVREIRDAATAAGIPQPRIRWVLQGPDKENREISRRMNQIYAQVVSESSNSASIDAGFEVSMAAYPYETIPDGRYTWTEFLPCSALERGTAYCTEPLAYGGVTRLHRQARNAFTNAIAVDAIHFCLDGHLDPQTGQQLISDPDAWHCDNPSPGVLRFGLRIAAEVNAALGI